MYSLQILATVVAASLLVLSLSVGDASAQETIDTFNLRVKSQPNIIFIGGAGSYSSGTIVTIEKAPEKWQDYEFLGWKVDGIWASGNPPVIRMESSHTAVAIYEKSDTGSIIVDTIPRIAEVTIDGEIYLPGELPASFDWSIGSDHIISISKIVSESPTTRYIFDSWKDRDDSILRTITVTDEKVDFIALYKTQHHLKPITEYGQVTGGGWKDEGSSVNFELESEYVIDKRNENIRHVFDFWSLGDYPNKIANSIDIIQPTTVQAKWDEEYKLKIITNVPDYNVFGTGWYPIDKQIALIAQENLESPKSDIKYVFDRWVSTGPNPVIIPNAQSPTTTITVEEPYVIQAKYKKSYQINAWTQYGNAIGAGFYDEGSVAEISISNTAVIVDPNKVRKVFTGWNSFGARVVDFESDDIELENAGIVPGGQNLVIFVDGPINVTAKWKTQYYLNVQSPEAETTGSGWYEVGRMAQISIKSPTIPPGLWSAQVFDKWTGDLESDTIKDRVVMNKPKIIVAEWREDSSPGIINALILGGVVVVGVVIYQKTNKMSFLKNGIKEFNKEQKPFDVFFNTRKQTPKYDTTPSFVQKKNKAGSIIDWLLGR